MKERNPRQRYTLMLSGNKRKRKHCNHQQGCSNGARGASNLCKAHGGGRRCVFEGCTASVGGTSNLCVTHKRSKLHEEMLVLAEEWHVLRGNLMAGEGSVQSPSDFFKQWLVVGGLFSHWSAARNLRSIKSVSSLEHELRQMISPLVE